MRNGPCPVCFDTRIVYRPQPPDGATLRAEVCERCRPVEVVWR